MLFPEPQHQLIISLERHWRIDRQTARQATARPLPLRQKMVALQFRVPQQSDPQVFQRLPQGAGPADFPAGIAAEGAGAGEPQPPIPRFVAAGHGDRIGRCLDRLPRQRIFPAVGDQSAWSVGKPEPGTSDAISAFGVDL